MSTPPPQQKDKSNGSLIAGPLHRKFYSGLPCALLSSHPELTRQRTTGQEQWQSDRWATAPENYSCLPCALLISHPKLTRGLRNLAGSVATTATSKTPEPYIDGARSRTSTNQGTCEREMTEAPSKRDICGAFFQHTRTTGRPHLLPTSENYMRGKCTSQQPCRLPYSGCFLQPRKAFPAALSPVVCMACRTHGMHGV